MTMPVWIMVVLLAAAVAILVSIDALWPEGTAAFRNGLDTGLVVTCILAGIMYVTARRRWSTQLRQQAMDHIRLRNILNAMSTAIVAVDRDGAVIGLNPAASEMLGVPLERALGRTFRELNVNPTVITFMDDAVQSRSMHTAQVQLDAGAREAIARSEPLGGQAGGIVLAMDDVTRLKRLETMRTDFAANVSHELRTPITSIQGYAELLDGASPKESADYARIIMGNTQRLSAIIEDLLALSRLEDEASSELPDLTEVSILSVLSNVAAACQDEAHRESVTLEIDVEADAVVNGSRQLLEQAITNLLTNAIRYGGNGSRVVLHLSAADEDSVAVRVIDKGPGIPLEHHARVFERFYRVDRGRSRQVGGTGLGLAIVKHIALAHGGAVSLAQTPGGGCTFTFKLPRL